MPFSLSVCLYTLCAYYYYDKSREMSVNTQNIPYEIWLIGAISAWDKVEMTTISFPFSFSIMLHKKSHFLAFLLIMNCAVLCPIGPSSQRPQTPTEEQCWCQTHWQRADFNKAMGNSFSKEGSGVWRRDDSQVRGWRHGDAHNRPDAPEITALLLTHTYWWHKLDAFCKST